MDWNVPCYRPIPKRDRVWRWQPGRFRYEPSGLRRIHFQLGVKGFSRPSCIRSLMFNTKPKVTMRNTKPPCDYCVLRKLAKEKGLSLAARDCGLGLAYWLFGNSQGPNKYLLFNPEHKWMISKLAPEPGLTFEECRDFFSHYTK